MPARIAASITHSPAVSASQPLSHLQIRSGRDIRHNPGNGLPDLLAPDWVRLATDTPQSFIQHMDKDGTATFTRIIRVQVVELVYAIKAAYALQCGNSRYLTLKPQTTTRWLCYCLCWLRFGRYRHLLLLLLASTAIMLLTLNHLHTRQFIFSSCPYIMLSRQRRVTACIGLFNH